MLDLIEASLQIVLTDNGGTEQCGDSARTVRPKSVDPPLCNVTNPSSVAPSIIFPSEVFTEGIPRFLFLIVFG